MGAPIVPRVSDPEKEPRQMRRFTERVSSIINSLFRNGGLVYNGADNYTVAGGGGSIPLTTKGDILGYDTAPDRIPVGPDGSVLTADSTAALGVSYQGSVAGLDPISSVYPKFTVTAPDDEFDGPSFTGWTSVTSGSPTLALTQANNVLSIAHPGGDGSGQLHAWAKAPTIVTNSYVEAGFRGWGSQQNFNLCGVFFSDGVTYGSGNQAVWYMSFNQNAMSIAGWSGFSSQSSVANHGFQTPFFGSDLFMRLQYTGTNTFHGFASVDGISFIDFTGPTTETVTPTHAGIFVSTYGGSGPFTFTYRYCKFR